MHVFFKIAPVQNVNAINPLNTAIAKVVVGERPKLNKTYFTNNRMPLHQGQHYRHIVPYFFIAKALNHRIKGLTSAQVATWLENATSYIENIYPGSGKINTSKSGSFNSAKTNIAEKWALLICNFNDVTNIEAVDAITKQSTNPITNEAFRFTANGRYYSRQGFDNFIAAIQSGKIRDSKFVIKANPGTKLSLTFNYTNNRSSETRYCNGLFIIKA